MTAHPISSTELSVTWRPPPQDKENGKIRHYNISVYQAATDEERWYRTPDSTAHWIVPSLHPYQVYHIRVAAVTIGTSPFSEQVEVRMLEEGTHTFRDCCSYIYLKVFFIVTSSFQSTNQFDCCGERVNIHTLGVASPVEEVTEWCNPSLSRGTDRGKQHTDLKEPHHSLITTIH